MLFYTMLIQYIKILVWQFGQDSPNFPYAKVSRYTVYSSHNTATAFACSVLLKQGRKVLHDCAIVSLQIQPSHMW